MKREEEIRLQILREASVVAKGTGLAWNQDQVANEIAVELIVNGFVIGSVTEHGTACVTGIRDRGRDFLRSQTPHRKALAVTKRILFLLYSLALLAIGYILNLDSVKAFFSKLIGTVLK